MKKVAIIGTVGVPANYGGFETLAENLVRQNARTSEPFDLTIYCSAKAYPQRRQSFEGARLRYISLNANGKQAMFYDMWSLIDAALHGTEVAIVLGHGGSFVIPLIKLFSNMKYVTNIDGIEWQRDKWTGLARWIIRKSEAFAIHHSHVVIADNEAIREHVAQEFARPCEVIAYGGDHALAAEPDPIAVADLPAAYALALCRIEPENNVAMILDAFAELDAPLVFVGNWEKSDYGRALKAGYGGYSNIFLCDPVYEPKALRAIRDRATVYIHGHSAGGTNPSLVEMMHFGIPVLAHGCAFNRFTTEGKARYFTSAEELVIAMRFLGPEEAAQIGTDMREIAQRRYTWEKIARAYFDLLKT